MEKTSTCKNCRQEFSGKYCSNCGQRSIANQRLVFAELVKDFLDNVFNLHKGLFYTCWKLIVGPGEVGNGYISGQRKQFTHPVRYLIIVVAIQAFFDVWVLHPGSELEHPGEVEFFQFPFLSSEVNKSMAIWNYRLVVQYSFIHNLTMIFLFPLVFRLLFRKLSYNLTELTVSNFYYVSTATLITLSYIIVSEVLFGSEALIGLVIGSTMGYMLWANMRFFKAVRFWPRLLKIMVALGVFVLFKGFLLLYLLGVLFPLSV